MKVHYISCATSSAVDGKTNRLSLFHVLDEISGPAFPLQLGSFCVASLFERDPSEDPVQSYALAVSLNGILLASFSMRLDFRGTRRNRTVNTIEGLAIPAPGAVMVSIVQRNDVLAVWRMAAIQVDLATAGGEVPKVPEHRKPTAAVKARPPTIN